MALKKVFQTMKSEGYVLKKLDQYLLSLNDKDEDRRWDINSPSGISRCVRAIYYSRTGAECDANSIDARTRRIFDNGTAVHERLQSYMMKAGITAMIEVPVFDKELQIQGHTDGLVIISKYELGVLEIKSINSNGFAQLIDAKEEHKEQAQVYMMVLERHRQMLNEMDEAQFKKYISSPDTYSFYTKLYDHVKDGRKYKREEKIAFKVGQHLQLDNLLWSLSRPISKMIFVYENKDTQETKEFTVKWDDDLVSSLEDRARFINDCVANKKMPEREGNSKSAPPCKWCQFRATCYIL